MTDEHWLPSPTFPLYEVSNLGRVRRADKVLAPFFYGRSFRVALREPRRQAVSVSSLVAEAFLDLPSISAARTTHTIIHLNHDRSDNRATNLLVLPRRKHLEADLQRALQLREDGVPYSMIEKLTGINKDVVRRQLRKSTRT